MIELIAQLDYKLEDLEQTIQDTVHGPSSRSKNAISALTPNTINRNATISVDSPNLKQRYRHLKKVPRVYTAEEKK